MTASYNAAAQGTQWLTRETEKLGSTLGRNILPILGVSAALNILTGSTNDATQSGLALSSAGYGLQTSLYGVQDALARTLIPFAEAAIPILSQLADAFVEADEATDGWSTRLILAGGAAAAATPLLRRLGGGAAAVGATRLVGGAAAGALGASAYGAVTGDTRAARYIDQQLGAQAASDALLRLLSPGLADRVAAQDQGPFEVQAEVWREQLRQLGHLSNNLERLANAPENFARNIYISAPNVVDTDGLIRTIRTLFEQGALDDSLGR